MMMWHYEIATHHHLEFKKIKFLFFGVYILFFKKTVLTEFKFRDQIEKTILEAKEKDQIKKTEKFRD